MNEITKDSFYDVVSNLSVKDVLNACTANKTFRSLCNNEQLWSRLLEKDFPNDFNLFKKDGLTAQQLYKLLYQLQTLEKKLLSSRFSGWLYKNLYDIYHINALIFSGGSSHPILTSLPKEIGILKNLEKLNIYNNRLTELPKEIGNLKNLKVLDVNTNRLTSLPSEIGSFTKLEKLNLAHNQLKILPDEIGNLKNLKILELDGNHLTILPSSIGNLTNLRELKLHDNNKLSKFPNELSNLINLRKLYVSENQLKTLQKIPGFSRLQKYILVVTRYRYMEYEKYINKYTFKN